MAGTTHYQKNLALHLTLVICHFYPRAFAFLDANEPFLLRHEAANGLLLGLGRRFRSMGDAAQNDALFVAVHSAAGPRLAAVMTPPHKLTLSHMTGPRAAAIATSVAALTAQPCRIPGVTGPAAVVDAFVAAWQQVTGAQVTPGRHMRIFDLRSVVDPRPARGRLRLANIGDIPLLTEWIHEFQTEVDEVVDRSRARALAELKVAEGDLFLWHDRQPVSMVARARPTVKGICVNLVYTPPALRGRGYAGNGVAALSRRLLKEGWEFCTLFTNLANPISNSIYQKIGYRPVCDFNEYTFADNPRNSRGKRKRR